MKASEVVLSDTFATSSWLEKKKDALMFRHECVLRMPYDAVGMSPDR